MNILDLHRMFIVQLMPYDPVLVCPIYLLILLKTRCVRKIRHERRVELAYEDFRFFDIRRWRIAEDVCNEYIQGYDVTKGKDGGFYTIVNVGDRMVFEKKTLPVSARYGRDSDESGT